MDQPNHSLSFHTLPFEAYKYKPKEPLAAPGKNTENKKNSESTCEQKPLSEEEMLLKCNVCRVSFGKWSSGLKPDFAPYWCKKCVKDSRKAENKNYLTTYSKSVVNKCSTCGKEKQKSNNNNDESKRADKGDNANNTCSTCEKPLSSERVSEKEVVKHICTLCSTVFTDLPTLKRHMNTHMLKCSQCDQKFTRKMDFVKHMKMHSRILRMEKVTKCTICGKSFPDDKSVKTHMEKQHICPICGKVNSGGHTRRMHIMRVHTGEKPYVCAYCGKSFSDNSTFLRHTRRHTGERPYVCSQCGKGFVSSWILKTHILTVHNKTKPHKCEVCGKSFYYNWHLTNHSVIHSQQNGVLFECKSCFKVFYSEQDLKAHKAKFHYYYPKKRVVCAVCGKTYTSCSSLKHHMYSHTNDSQKYKCTTCGKGYPAPISLRHHMKISHGEKIACPICGKVFSIYGSSYTRHQQQHLGVKDHTCSVCGKSFLLRSSLTRHMRTHTGEKPFKCLICNVAFSDPSTLYKHKKRLHP